MKFKKLFSFPKRKKVRKKLLDQLQQPDSQFDAGQVTGGAQSNDPKQPNIGWYKNDSSGGPKL